MLFRFRAAASRRRTYVSRLYPLPLLLKLRAQPLDRFDRQVQPIGEIPVAQSTGAKDSVCPPDIGHSL
jgi:hypothetical protein